MKKIMFDDHYGLTEAVLQGRKTMTRRIIPNTAFRVYKDMCRLGTPTLSLNDYLINRVAQYKIGEVVAIAQSYLNAGLMFIQPPDPQWGSTQDMAGFRNKMFVRADLMPNRIRFTNVGVERLQDIGEGDVYKEGFEKQSVNNGWGNAAWHWEAMLTYMDDLGRYKDIRSAYPKEAFAVLIDKISGIGTWDNNPFVFAYEFELVK
jgi:hypothetical protein